MLYLASPSQHPLPCLHHLHLTIYMCLISRIYTHAQSWLVLNPVCSMGPQAKHSGLHRDLCNRCFFSLSSPPPPIWLQYSYEGMEINNLPVELTVVWNGHFNIDNPAQNKGVKRLRLVEKA